MGHGILLVDDQRDILRLLHSTLDTLKNSELEIFESPSGEEALLEVGRRNIDMLVADYLLPGMTGIELMHKVRAKNPEVKVVLISGMTDRKARDEMLNAGAVALFDKPIPLADFLDVVERNLGLVRTIFPPESDVKSEARRSRISDLLANFRQDIKAQAVFLLNERGMVMARAGDLRDSSMEVSLLSALSAIFGAGMKVAKFNRQEIPVQYFVFNGGDHDLLLIPIDTTYSLLLAGNGITNRENLPDTIDAMLALRKEVERSLRSMGVTAELKEQKPSPAASAKQKAKTGELPAAPPAPEMEALLKGAKKKVKQDEMDDFWNKAAEQHAGKSTNPEVISYEQARKMGLTPDEKKK
ncbi:MAG: response regulator [Chloroflexi bacterium]|nr:response regulator [Chloroflexota bacterium]